MGAVPLVVEELVLGCRRCMRHAPVRCEGGHMTAVLTDVPEGLRLRNLSRRDGDTWCDDCDLPLVKGTMADLHAAHEEWQVQLMAMVAQQHGLTATYLAIAPPGVWSLLSRAAMTGLNDALRQQVVGELARREGR